MTYSKIERSFWETDEARELTPEEKYFWMYLQTNANVNTLGCYAFRMRKAVDETGYNKDTLEKLLDIMIQRGMILYDATTREIFLLHWGKTNWNRQTATLRAMKADLKEIRSEMIKFKINTQLEKSGIFTKEGENDKVSEENDKAENAEISAKTANKENNSEQMGTIGNNQGGEGEGEGEGEGKKKKEKRSKCVFTPPTLEEVQAYCKERGNRIDPQYFLDYYTSTGWMRGKVKLKDWKAAVRTWERQDAKWQGQTDDRQQGTSAPGAAAAAKNKALMNRRDLVGG